MERDLTMRIEGRNIYQGEDLLAVMPPYFDLTKDFEGMKDLCLTPDVQAERENGRVFPFPTMGVVFKDFCTLNCNVNNLMLVDLEEEALWNTYLEAISKVKHLLGDEHEYSFKRNGTSFGELADPKVAVHTLEEDARAIWVDAEEDDENKMYTLQIKFADLWTVETLEELKEKATRFNNKGGN